MPDEYSIQHLKIVKDRKGSIGSEVLRRFTVVFNYPENKVHFRPNKHLNDPFLIDGSGLEIKQDGLVWEKEQVKVETSKRNSAGNEINVIDNTPDKFQYKFSLKPVFKVSGTRKDSPAQKSGIIKGDEITNIDGKKANELTLYKIHQILKTDERKTVSVEIKRNEIRRKIDLFLEDPIPYIEE